MAWIVKEPILRTSEMALRLAEVLFDETQPTRKFEWFSPFTLEDGDGIWFVSGKVDPKVTLSPDASDDQLEDPVFHMYVAKADSEVKGMSVSFSMKLSPELKAQMRAVLEAEGNQPLARRAKRSRDYMEDISVFGMLYGGIINSSRAAIRFGELVFENNLGLEPQKFRKMHAEEVEGFWHVFGVADDKSAELVFRRFNAQVISLDMRPFE
jgi:hypothetical protein